MIASIEQIKETKPTEESGKKRQFRRAKPSFQKREKPEAGKISVLDIRRVAKVGKGSKRLSFSAFVVVGDMQGSVGIALGKSRDVNTAIQQAAAKARKLQSKFYLNDMKTLPHSVEGSFCASKVILRNAKDGTGIIAGKVVRAIVECWVGPDFNIVSKVYGSRNPINVAAAVMKALHQMKTKNSAE